MTGLLTFILIIYGLVWIVKKDDFAEEIKRLKHRITALESEVLQLKCIPVEQTETVQKTDIGSSTISDIEPVKEQVITENTEFESLYKHACSVQSEVTEQSEIIDEKTKEQIDEPVIEAVIENSHIPKNKDMEAFVTANLFNKIGAVALIIGMGFFLKYAFDQNWISPIIQVLFGFLVSGCLIYGANHFFKKEDYKNFSQGLAGSGIAISCLSIFAAHNFYHLINYPFALILMCCSTILAFTQAIKYDSIAVALLGLTGGFLTPFMLYSESTNSISILSYLVFLNGWIIALLVKKQNWHLLEVISILTTYIIFFVSGGTTGLSSLTILFLITIWIGYSGLEIFRVYKGQQTRVLVNILNGFLFYVGIATVCGQNFKAMTTFLISMVYLAAGVVVYQKFNKPESYLKQNVIASILLLVLATNTAFTGFDKVIVWSVEAFTVLWLGVKYKKSYVWKSANYLFSLTMITLLFTKQALGYAQLDNFLPVFNLRTLSFLLLGGLMASSSNLLKRIENAKSAQEYLNYCWCTLLFVILSVEINDIMSKFAMSHIGASIQLINFNKSMIQVIVWVSYALQLFKSGLNKHTKALVYCGLLGLAIAVTQLLSVGSAFSPIERFTPVINLRFITFIIASLGLMYVSNLCKNHKQDLPWLESIKNICTYGWCILLFVLLNCEITDFFAKKAVLSGEIQEGITFSKNMILGFAWSLYSIPLIKRGLSNNASSLVICGSVSLVLALFMGVLGGLSFTPIESYTFIFNERILMFSALVIALVSTTKWLKQCDTDTSRYRYIKAIQITLSLLVFLILTIEIKDMFAKQIFLLANDNSLAVNSQLDLLSNLKQLSISGIWLLYSIGLMVWGIVHKIKAVRYIALSILGITVLKVFVFDLSFLDQLYRIISFMGLGVIMLLMSYFYQKYSEQIKKLLTEDELHYSDSY